MNSCPMHAPREARYSLESWPPVSHAFCTPREESLHSQRLRKYVCVGARGMQRAGINRAGRSAQDLNTSSPLPSANFRQVGRQTQPSPHSNAEGQLPHRRRKHLRYRRTYEGQRPKREEADGTSVGKPARLRRERACGSRGGGVSLGRSGPGHVALSSSRLAALCGRGCVATGSRGARLLVRGSVLHGLLHIGRHLLAGWFLNRGALDPPCLVDGMYERIGVRLCESGVRAFALSVFRRTVRTRSA